MVVGSVCPGVHDRAAQVLVARRAGRAHAADRVLEQRVAGEDVALDEQGEHALRVAGGVQRGDLEIADAHHLARAHRPRDAVDRLVGMSEDLQIGPALLELAELLHVIAVVVGEQHVRRGDAVALGRGDERRDRPPGVDEESLAAALPDEVGVRQVVLVHGAFDDHRRHATGQDRAGGRAPGSGRAVQARPAVRPPAGAAGSAVFAAGARPGGGVRQRAARLGRPGRVRADAHPGDRPGAQRLVPVHVSVRADRPAGDRQGAPGGELHLRRRMPRGTVQRRCVLAGRRERDRARLPAVGRDRVGAAGGLHRQPEHPAPRHRQRVHAGRRDRAGRLLPHRPDHRQGRNGDEQRRPHRLLHAPGQARRIPARALRRGAGAVRGARARHERGAGRDDPATSSSARRESAGTTPTTSGSPAAPAPCPPRSGPVRPARCASHSRPPRPASAARASSCPVPARTTRRRTASP
jgi:hypothetical protein